MNAERTFVALLRAVNLAGRNKVSMPELRSSLTSLGLQDVVTYIQSGNVVFRSPIGGRKEIAARIERQIAEAFGVNATVLLRTPAELVKIAEGNPFLKRGADRSKLHVVFLADGPAEDAVARLDPGRSPPDELRVRGNEIYLHLPNGSGRSKFTLDYFERQLGVAATARNWNTVLKLRALTES